MTLTENETTVNLDDRIGSGNLDQFDTFHRVLFHLTWIYAMVECEHISRFQYVDSETGRSCR